MRTLFRLVAPVLAAAAIALGSGSAALAAASPSSESLDANWCFQDVTALYCFDVTGHATTSTTRPAASLTLQQTTVTTVYEAGVGRRSRARASSSFAVSSPRTARPSCRPGSTRARGSARSDCVYHMVLKIVDYEVTVDHTTSTCTGPV